MGGCPPVYIKMALFCWCIHRDHSTGSISACTQHVHGAAFHRRASSSRDISRCDKTSSGMALQAACISLLSAASVHGCMQPCAPKERLASMQQQPMCARRTCSTQGLCASSLASTPVCVHHITAPLAAAISHASISELADMSCAQLTGLETTFWNLSASVLEDSLKTAGKQFRCW